MDNLSIIDVNKPDKVKDALNELINYKNNAQEIPTITAETLGLGNVDNTKDINKPLSTPQKEYVDQVNEENVKLQSDTKQTIDSDIELAEGRSLYGVRANNSPEALISVKNEGGYEFAQVGGKNIPLKLAHSVKDIANTDVGKNPKITIKDADGATTEDSMALLSDLESMEERLEETASATNDLKVDKSVFAEAEVSNGVVTDVDGEYFENADIDAMNLKVHVRSIEDGSLLRELNLPFKIATSSSRGLMSKEDVATLNALLTRVASLEGRNARYLYTDKTNPTALEIDAFAQDQGAEEPYSSVAIVVDGTYHVWHYYENDNIGWKDDGVDTVLQATNELLGIVIGSEIAGKIYIESDGSMSLVGYDALTSRITSLENEVIESITFTGGTNNGTLKATITINGIDTVIDNIAITGLGSAAFTDSSQYAAANHTHTGYLTEHQDISGKENNSNKVSSISNATSTTLYPSNKAVVDYVTSIMGDLETLLSEV